jgi:hypothetical protein
MLCIRSRPIISIAYKATRQASVTPIVARREIDADIRERDEEGSRQSRYFRKGGNYNIAVVVI